MSKSTLKLAHSADAIPLANLSARSIASASRTHVPEVKLEDGDAITVAKEPSKLDGTNGNIYAASTYLSERTKRPQISEHSKQHGNSHKNISEIRLEALPVPVDLRDSNPRSSSVHTSSSRVYVNHKRNSLIQFLSLCYCLGMVGWNDGTTGPLLPTLQEYYKGYICAGILNIWLNDRLGFGKILAIGTLFQLCGYAIIIIAPPFPLLICAYVIAGFGVSFQVAQCNGFVASLNKHMTLKLGILQGAYGLGAFLAPFSSTYFSKLAGRQWSYHFIVSVVLTLYTFFDLGGKTVLTEVLLDAGQEQSNEYTQQEHGSKYRQIFSLKCIPLLAVFTLIYIGVEVTLGGWIVTFIIQKRGGGSNSGYISSGFFGASLAFGLQIGRIGLTIGRLCLMWLNKLVGEYRIVIIYAFIAIGLVCSKYHWKCRIRV
ncbi:hypothetical protein CVT25_005564 [Psilocybe cyanescens]|uniref:Major facilitator superfamily (MFS) profile domain-containing protein n=1 Tax=Psilocybe cyanescens TaxID=93625 RepID=A0A409XRY0_PSICY|nr:hypothetical protein CVT25_005564 [Psilocybe cyanescens]